MQPGVLVTVFALIFVAELPDKTMIAMLVMGSRYRPVAVWVGASAAFAVHVVVAVAVGRLLQLLPHVWVEGVTAVLFAGGAVYLLAVPERQAAEEGESEAGAAKRLHGLGAAFTVILVGEFGDLTQLLTANLAAKYGDPLAVGIGSLTALVAVAALASFGGRALVRILPLAVIRRAGGVILAGFAVYTLVQLLRG